MPRRAALVLSGCLLACSSTRTAPGKVTMFTRAWTLEADAPYGDGTLRYATLGDATSFFDGRVIATATGAERWTAQGIALELTAEGVIERVAGDRIGALRVLDAATGAVTRELALVDDAGQPVQLRAYNAGLAVIGGRLVYSYLGRSQAFDLATGRQLWQHATGGTSSVAVGAGALIGLVGAGELVALDAATGSERWRAPLDGADTDVVASPRGGFFVPRGERVIELGDDGREVRAVAGRFSAADGDFLAVMHGRDVVVVDGVGREVERIRPASAADYLSAPGLCGRAVVYFRHRDATVWWQPAGGAEVPIVKLEVRRGEIEGQPRVVAPTLTEPPRCVAGLVLIQDWTLAAYRIPA